jgi:hypothetical protein
MLPSAMATSAPEPDVVVPSEAPRETSSAGAGRRVFIVAMAVAAIGLIGAIAYLAVNSGGGDHDPAAVGMQEDDVAESAPTVTATATAAPKKPPPPKYRPAKKKKVDADDVYDGL